MRRPILIWDVMLNNVRPLTCRQGGIVFNGHGCDCCHVSPHMEHKTISARAKLCAITMNVEWPPVGQLEGTLYTIKRDDLELFEIIKDWGDGHVNVICHLPDGQQSPWEFEDFFGMEYHKMRAVVLPRILEVYP